MALACRLIIWGFAAAYLLALLLFLVGTFGWFGSEKGPLAGVFLLPLGLPWNQFLRWFPESLSPFLAAGVPLLNLAILRAICLRLHGTGAS